MTKKVTCGDGEYLGESCGFVMGFRPAYLHVLYSDTTSVIALQVHMSAKPVSCESCDLTIMQQPMYFVVAVVLSLANLRELTQGWGRNPM